MKEYKRLTEKDWHKEKFYPTADNERLIRKRLWDLENKIENGTLIELPCKVGDTVYEVRKVCCSIMDGYREFDWDIRTISFSVDMFNAIGKSIFLTREEAKKVLEEKVREMLIAEYKG